MKSSSRNNLDKSKLNRMQNNIYLAEKTNFKNKRLTNNEMKQKIKQIIIDINDMNIGGK